MPNLEENRKTEKKAVQLKPEVEFAERTEAMLKQEHRSEAYCEKLKQEEGLLLNAWKEIDKRRWTWKKEQDTNKYQYINRRDLRDETDLSNFTEEQEIKLLEETKGLDTEMHEAWQASRAAAEKAQTMIHELQKLDMSRGDADLTLKEYISLFNQSLDEAVMQREKVIEIQRQLAARRRLAEKIAYRSGGNWAITKIDRAIKKGERQLSRNWLVVKGAKREKLLEEITRLKRDRDFIKLGDFGNDEQLFEEILNEQFRNLDSSQEPAIVLFRKFMKQRHEGPYADVYYGRLDLYQQVLKKSVADKIFERYQFLAKDQRGATGPSDQAAEKLREQGVLDPGVITFLEKYKQARHALVIQASLKTLLKESGSDALDFAVRGLLTPLQELEKSRTAIIPEKWELFKSNPAAVQVCGKELINEMDAFLADGKMQEILNSLLATLPNAFSDNVRAHLVQQIVEMTNFFSPRQALFTLLATYYQSGPSGTRHLWMSEFNNEEEAPILGFAKKLNQSQEAAIREELGVVGEELIQILNIIKEDPQNYWKSSINDPKIDEFQKGLINNTTLKDELRGMVSEGGAWKMGLIDYLEGKENIFHPERDNFKLDKLKNDDEYMFSIRRKEDGENFVEVRMKKEQAERILKAAGMRTNLLLNPLIENPSSRKIEQLLAEIFKNCLLAGSEPALAEYVSKLIQGHLVHGLEIPQTLLLHRKELEEAGYHELLVKTAKMAISSMSWRREQDEVISNRAQLEEGIAESLKLPIKDINKLLVFLRQLTSVNNHRYEEIYLDNYLIVIRDKELQDFSIRLSLDYGYYFSASNKGLAELQEFYSSSDREQLLSLFKECSEKSVKDKDSLYLSYSIAPLRLLNEQAPERKNALWQLVADLGVYNYEFAIVSIPQLLEFLDNKAELLTLIPELVKLGYSFYLADTALLKSLLKEKKDVVSVAKELVPYGYRFAIRDIDQLDKINNIFIHNIREKQQLLQLINNLKMYGYQLNLDDFINGKLLKVLRVQEAFLADLSQRSEKRCTIMLEDEHVRMPYDQGINNTVAGYRSSNALKQMEGDLGQEKLAEMQAWGRIASLFALIENQEITLPPEVTDKIKTYFKAEENMDFCLNKFQTEWLEFLEQGKQTFSAEINELNSIIAEHGIGHLRLVESISGLMKTVKELATDGKTRQEIRNGFLSQEKRFAAERWSNQEKAVFYDISNDILEISTSLYPDFLEVIAELDRTELEIFSTELLPLFHAQLIILEKTDQQGKTHYSGRELVRAVREKLRELKNRLNVKKLRAERERILEEEKGRLIEVIKSGFKERFGILKVPEIFDKDKVKILTDLVRYLGNIHERNEQKEKVWTLLLVARLNEEWGTLRRGEELAVEDLLVPEKVQEVKNILANRKSFETITAANLKIEEESLPKFQTILQEEVSTLMLGQVETVDLKLGNVARNLAELQDPDVYLSQERVLFDLAQQFGNKKINAVLAKKYRNLTGKEDSWDDGEQKILEQLSLNFVLDQPEKIKPLQDQFAPVAAVFALNNGIGGFQIENEIADLQQKLLPPTRVVEIINRISDEEFTAQSGALAVTSDVMYLREVVAKHQNELADEEKKTIGEYLTQVEKQVVKLEGILQKIRKDFAKAAKQIEKSQSPALVARLKEAEKVVMGEGSAALEFTTRMTGDLKVVIENIRACLGCLTKQCNNDTNLTFADSNRFLLTSHAVGKEGSFADQLVFLLPIIEDNDRQEVAFVMDNVYGHKVADVLLGHLQAVYKKYQTLKKESPKAKLSIFVTQAALTSVGLSADILKQRIKASFAPEAEMVSAEKVKVTVPKSAFGDYYIEFGGGTRTTGERTVSGLMIR